MDSFGNLRLAGGRSDLRNAFGTELIEPVRRGHAQRLTMTSSGLAVDLLGLEELVGNFDGTVLLAGIGR